MTRVGPDWQKLGNDGPLSPWEHLPGIEISDEKQAVRAVDNGDLTLYRAPDSSEVASHNAAAYREWQAQREAQRASRPRFTAADDDKRRYAVGALVSAENELSATAKGQRENVINTQCLKLGRYVNGGHLSLDEVVEVMSRAAYACQWAQDDCGSDQKLRAKIERAVNDQTETPNWPDVDWHTTYSDAPFDPSAGVKAWTPYEGDETGEPKSIKEIRIEQELDKQRIRREAARRLDAEERPAIQYPPVKSLSVLLAEPDTPTRYRIDKVAPDAARVLLSAQFKAGKTTLVGNLLRSLGDGDPFLGQFTVHTPARRIVLIDDEMSENTLRRWLRDQNVVNTSAVADVIALRGRVSAFNLLDTRCHAEWAARLRDVGCDYLILDCLRPVLDALGLDENRDAGRFLVAFDALLAEAGVADAAMVHHMGHANERARGDSRLQDWPDAIWRLVRETDEPDSARFFSAYGRDVDVHEGRLNFDPSTRRLSFAAGSRQDTKVEAAKLAVVDLLVGSEPLSGRKIEIALGDAHPQKAIRDGIGRAIREELIIATPGARRSTEHAIRHPCSVCGKPVASRRASHESCADQGSK